MFCTIFVIPPVLVLWFLCDVILESFGIPPQVAEYAGIYCKFIAPGIWPVFGFEACRRFLQSQEIYYPGTVISAIVLPFHFL